jgi:hypothetical protein
MSAAALRNKAADTADACVTKAMAKRIAVAASFTRHGA